MQEHILTISRGSQARLLSIGTILIALAFAWFSIRWQIGDLFVEAASPGSADAAEIAETAKALAPSSPKAYWLSGAILKASFDEPTVDLAIRQFEGAIRRSPHYFRAWSELGRMNEQAERYDQAEAAFRKAVELAPEYTIPHWQAGNFYLRRGRIPDAVDQFNAAAKHSSPYRLQVFSTAWNVLGKDPRQIEQFLTDSGDSKATLARFYSSINRPDDAIRVWNMIDPDAKPVYGWQVNAIAQDMLAYRAYRGALEFSRQAGIDPDARPEVITNGDFELPIKGSDRPLRFDWTLVRTDGKIDAASDSSVAHAGRRSLKFAFRGFAKPVFATLRQAVAVTPKGRYHVSFWVRTENLKSGSMPFIEVHNAKDDQRIALSPAFRSDTSDWQQMNIEFLVPEESDGIYLITSREPCPDECPMSGIFWLDDFSLERLN